MIINGLCKGNWVQDNCGNPVKVDIELLVELDYVNSEYFRPIDLTEQILLDSDFYKRKDKYIKGSFEIYIGSDGGLFYDWMGGNIEIKYVHHLQNIYYFLTEKELEVVL